MLSKLVWRSVIAQTEGTGGEGGRHWKFNLQLIFLHLFTTSPPCIQCISVHVSCVLHDVAVWTVQCAVCSVQCSAVCSVQCAVSSVQCSVQCAVQCELYSAAGVWRVSAVW